MKKGLEGDVKEFLSRPKVEYVKYRRNVGFKNDV